MKATNLFASRRDMRRIQAGWVLILLSALAALGAASAITAADAGEGVGLEVGLIAGAVPLIAGELWLLRTTPPSRVVPRHPRP